RYRRRLWMAPWEPVPAHPPAPGTNRTLAAIRRHVEFREAPIPLASYISGETELSPAAGDELLKEVGSDAEIGFVSALNVTDLGSHPRHSFLLDETHLRIVTRSDDAPGDTSPLSRDPHLTPRRTIVPLRGPSVPLETKSRLVAQVRFRPTLTLVVL